MTHRSTVAPLAVAALLLAAAPPSRAAAPPSRGASARTKAHVDTRGEQDCAACHRTETPAAFADWERSPHGVALVKCVVCHGSTGRDFRPKPAATGCGSCHAAQAESVARRAVADCFACHAPHTLSAHPHR
jgi:hypothetical protein